MNHYSQEHAISSSSSSSAGSRRASIVSVAELGQVGKTGVGNEQIDQSATKPDRSVSVYHRGKERDRPIGFKARQIQLMSFGILLYCLKLDEQGRRLALDFFISREVHSILGGRCPFSCHIY